MAPTVALKNLIDEFPSAFADPEWTTPAIAPTLPEEVPKENLSQMDTCWTRLMELEYESELLSIAANVLKELAAIARLKKNAGVAVVARIAAESPVVQEYFNLPETFSRQGTPECPGGACPMDGH